MSASSSGFRYELPVTIVPSMACRVSAAIADSSVQPSKCVASMSPNSGKKWSHIQMESAPMASARRQASRSAATDVACGWSWQPTLSVMRGIMAQMGTGRRSSGR